MPRAPASRRGAAQHDMFSFFRKKAAEPQAVAAEAPVAVSAAPVSSAPSTPAVDTQAKVGQGRGGWIERLRGGLRKTGSSITQVFSTARIDDALYDELEAALLMADAGPTA